jgi:hypothetical protein
MKTERSIQPNSFVPQSYRSGYTTNLPIRVLVLSALSSGEWEQDAQLLEADGYTFNSLYLNVVDSRTYGKLLAPFRHSIVHAMRHADIIFSGDANVTLGTAAAMALCRIRKPHVALTFNLTNRQRFHPAVDWLAEKVLPNISFILTPSDVERHHFSRCYSIPIERFGFLHWGVPNTPKPNPEMLPRQIRDCKPYFCAIGRNNRDFVTFCDALRGAPYNGVIVTARGLCDASALPTNVKVFYDLSFEECLQCIDASVANVIPLKDPDIGAGHITMVHAMHRAVPQIVTRAASVADYFLFGIHGLGVELGNPQSLRSAMDHLFAHRDTEAREMGERGCDFAKRWLSHTTFVPMIRAVLEALRSGGPFPTAPVGWEDFKASLPIGSQPCVALGGE